MDIERLKKLVKESLKDGLFSLSTPVLESKAVDTISDEYLPKNTILLSKAEVEEPAHGKSIIVHGRGVDYPFKGMGASLEFALQGGEVSLDLIARGDADWSLSTGFPPFRNTFAAMLRFSGTRPPVISLSSHGATSGKSKGMFFEGALEPNSLAAVMAGFIGAKEQILSGPVKLKEKGSKLQQVDLAIPPVESVDFGIAVVKKLEFKMGSANGYSPHKKRDLTLPYIELAAKIPFTARGKEREIPVSVQIVNLESDIRFSADLSAGIDAGLDELKNLANQIGFKELLPTSDFPISDILKLKEFFLDFNASARKKVSVIGIGVENRNPWKILHLEQSKKDLIVNRVELDLRVYEPFSAPAPWLGISGEVAIGDGVFLIDANLPDWTIHGYLKQGTKINLTDILKEFMGSIAGAPTLEIDDLEFELASGNYSLAVALASSWPVGKMAFSIDRVGLSISYSEAEKTKAAVQGNFRIANVDVAVKADYPGEKAGWTFNGKIPKINLNEIAKYLLDGASLPGQLPEVEFSDIDITVTPGTGAFSINGKATVEWKFGSQKLTTNVVLSLNRKAAEADGQDANSNEIDCTINLKATGPLSVIEELKLKEFDLNFKFTQDAKERKWTIGGGLKASFFEKDVSLAAKYESENKMSLSVAVARDLISLDGIATLKASKFTLYLERAKEKNLKWDVEVASGLKIAEAHEFTGTMKLYNGPKKAGFALKLDESSNLSVTLAKPPLSPRDISLKISSGEIVIVRDDKKWSFEASSTTSLTVSPPYPFLNTIIPDKVVSTLKVDSKSVSLSIDKVTAPIEFELPDIKLPNGTVVKLDELRALGKASIQLTDLSVKLGSQALLTATLGIGLPEHLNKIFGVKKEDGKTPALQVFKTRPHIFKLVFGIGYVPKDKTAGVYFNIASSPFHKLDIQEGIWRCDLGNYGAVDIKVPTFSFTANKGFSASSGFDIVRTLKFPLVPFKETLKRAGAGKAAELLPDSVPLDSFTLLDANKKFDVEGFIKRINALLAASGLPPIGENARRALLELAKRADRLPEGLTQYLNIEIPKSFSFSIAITADAGINIDIKIDKDRPIKLLYPGMTPGLPIPAIQGLKLRGFSLGTMMGGSLFSIGIDAEFDQFDIVSLLAGLILPETGILPPAKDFHRRLIINDFSMLLVIVYGIPIPVPLFYKQLAIQYLGIEGVRLQSHISFPVPSFNPMELIKLAAALKEFFTDKGARIKLDRIPKDMELSFSLNDWYIEMPKYLGSGLLGKKGKFLEVKLLETIAKLLNAIKFLSLEEITTLMRLEDRVGSEKITFVCLTMEAKWLLTTPKEFFDIAYKQLVIPEDKRNDYLKLLGQGDNPKGIVVFLKGKWELLDGVAGLETAFGLIVVGSRGFMTHFSIAGRIKGLIDVKLEGEVALALSDSIDKQSSFQLKGCSYLAFLGIDIFKGDILVQVARDRFHFSGAFQLFPRDFPVYVRGNIDGTLTNQAIAFDSLVEVGFGPIVLMGAYVMISNDWVKIRALWWDGYLEFTVVDDKPRNQFRISFNTDAGICKLHGKLEIEKQTKAAKINIYANILQELYELEVETTNKPSVAVKRGQTISLRSSYDHMIALDGEKGLRASSESVDDWLLLHIVDPSDHTDTEPVHYGDTVCLLNKPFDADGIETSEQHYLTAEDAGVGIAIGTQGSGEDRRWTLVDPVDPSSREPVPSYGRVALRSHYDTYLAASNPGQEISAQRNEIGPSEKWSILDKIDQEAILTVKHKGLVLVKEGISLSAQKQFTLSGPFNLIPRVPGFDLYVIGKVDGHLNRGQFNLGGSVEAKLGPLSLTKTSINFTQSGLVLSGQWLGAGVELSLQVKGSQIETIFGPRLGPLAVTSTLKLNTDGRGGSFEILAGIEHVLSVYAMFRLPNITAGCSLTLLGIRILNGTLTALPGSLSISGSIHLPFPPPPLPVVLELKAAIEEGTIDNRGITLRARGRISSWIRLVPGSTAIVRLENGSLTASLTVDVINVGGAFSFRIWRNQPCFMLAWRLWTPFGDKNHLAVNLSGSVVFFELCWRTWVGDWPPELRVGGDTAEQPAPDIDFDSIEPVPLLDLVRFYSFYDWQNLKRQEPFDAEAYLKILATFRKYQLGLRVEIDESSASADHIITMPMQKSADETDFFTELHAEVSKWLANDVTDQQELASLLDIQYTGGAFETTTTEAKEGKVTLTVEFIRSEKTRSLSVEFDFDNPSSSYQRLAGLLRSSDQ
jgi:hypothetical protein